MRSGVGGEGQADRDGFGGAQSPPFRGGSRGSGAMTGPLGQTLTLCAYYAVLAVLALYGAHRGLMVFLYYRHRRDAPQPAGRLAPLPRVTVQLPIYNEVYVVERLVESVAAIDYLRERLEIQLLDDSDDDTRVVASALTERLAACGFAITHRARGHRRGFKAGALQDGLSAASGE